MLFYGVRGHYSHTTLLYKRLNGGNVTMALDMDKRSKITNLCNWGIAFTLPNSKGEILLEAKQSTSINNGELVTLADNQDIMFYGTDRGDHARVFVDNKEYRTHVGFDNDENKHKQFVLNDDECKKIFDLKTQSAFEKNVISKVVMTHEKDIIMDYARKSKINDYDKIEFLENHTELKYRR